MFKTFKGPVCVSARRNPTAKPIEPEKPTICGITSTGAVFKEGKWQSLGNVSLPANLPKK